MGPQEMFCASAHLVSVILKSQMAFSVLEMIEIVKRITMHIKCEEKGAYQTKVKG